MTPILHALRWDVIVQARNGFYWASAFLIIVISALLLSLPESARANSAVWVPAILVINLIITFGWSGIAFVWGRNRIGRLMRDTRATGGR